MRLAHDSCSCQLTDAATHWIYFFRSICLYPSLALEISVQLLFRAQFGTSVMILNCRKMRKWYKIGQLWNIFCITFNFSDLFLTCIFYEFRNKITILHPKNCKACEKCTACSQNARVVIWLQALFLHKRCFLRFSNKQVSVNDKS